MRRISIVSKPEYADEPCGSNLEFVDVDTREILDNVQCIGISTSLDDKMWARMTTVKMKDYLHCSIDDEGYLIEQEEDVEIQSIHIG